MPPQAQNTEKTIESFATGTQYKMTMRVFKPSGAYTTTTKYMLLCVSFELVPNGAGTNVWAKEFCGPLTDLASYFLSPEQDEEWPLENTMPSSEQLFREYIETYKKYT